jgi:hypothetical protein
MTREQEENLIKLKTAFVPGSRLEIRRYLRRCKIELEGNLTLIANERAKGPPEPHRRPHLRYIKRRSIQGLEVIHAFRAWAKSP